MGYPEWYCICGHPWYGAHEKQYRQDSKGQAWRDALCRMNPWKQWVRESMPSAWIVDEPGFSYGCDDGIMGVYTRPMGGGPMALIEVKSFGKDCNQSDRQMMIDLHSPHLVGGLFIQLKDGNVPTPLKHFPAQRPIDDPDAQPEIVQVATSVRIATIRHGVWQYLEPMPGDRLAGWLYDYLTGHLEDRTVRA